MEDRVVTAGIRAIGMSQIRLLRRAGQFTRRWPVLSGGILCVVVLLAVLAPVISPHSPLEHDLSKRFLPPMWAGGTPTHPLGTDTLGRDLFARIIYGARVSLIVGTVALASGILVGTSTGMVAGYYGGITDELVTRIVDVWYGLPFILVALLISLAMGPGLITISILLALLAWAPFVRQVRGLVLTLRTREYVLSAKVSGAPTSRIFAKHLLPGVMNIVLVIASFRVTQLILAEAFLSFLGAGIPPPVPSWGNIIAEGRDYIVEAWWVSVFPGILLLLTSIGLSFLGDWIRDFTDPRLRQVGEGGAG